jgi:predicted dehydrogenase
MATRLGLIGRGNWGRNIEQTLLSLGEVSVIAIARDEPIRRDLDGVLIASPSVTHAELALPYIQAGIATFIEKPMATSVADAQRIREAAGCSNAAVFVGHLHLYNPAFLALLKLLPALGTIRYVLCDSANGNPRMDSSVLWDWLPHDLSMARAILREDPGCVQAWSLTDAQKVEAAVSRYQYGAASLVSVMSWLSPIRRQQMTISAERGVLIFDDRSAQKLSLHEKDGCTSHPGYDNELPLTSELRAFLDVVRSHSTDASQIALGVAIAEAIEGAQESISNGGTVVEIPNVKRSGQ